MRLNGLQIQSYIVISNWNRMETQTDILKTLLGQEIGTVLYGSSIFLPFEDSDQLHIFNNLAFIVLEKQKMQLIEYKLVASNPIYRHHENRCKLMIRKHTHEMKDKYSIKTKGYENSLSIDLNADRIWMIENSCSSEYLEELKEYPTLTSTIALEDIRKDRYLVVSSYKGQSESYMKRISVKFGTGFNLEGLAEVGGMKSHVVGKFEFS